METSLQPGRRTALATMLATAGASLTMSALAQTGTQRKLDLAGYQSTDGAVRLFRNGDFSDPYFAGQALISAWELGLNIAAPLKLLLDWLIRRQNVDGTFARYCLNTAGWSACQITDADDSLCAIVIELIVIEANGKAPNSQRQSAMDRCLSLLGKLKSRRGTYSLSQAQPVQLLMDNCEVHRSLARVARHFSLVRDRRANTYTSLATTLRAAVVSQFWVPTQRAWLMSSQFATLGTPFYPDACAQLFPALCGLEAYADMPHLDIDAWVAKYSAAWTAGTADEYPWGLLAQVMRMTGRQPMVDAWLKLATGLRSTGRWHVLEEAIFQALQP